jgi:hypothetical protein
LRSRRSGLPFAPAKAEGARDVPCPLAVLAETGLDAA